MREARIESSVKARQGGVLIPLVAVLGALLLIVAGATTSSATNTPLKTLSAVGAQTGSNSSGCAFTYARYASSNYASTTRSTGSSCWQVKVRHSWTSGGSGGYTSWKYTTSGTVYSVATATIGVSEHRGCWYECLSGW